MKKNDDYTYEDLSKNVERELAIILGGISHHTHPDICNYIRESNEYYKSEFESICDPSCEVESFFYSGSDCVFPGFRRPINNERKVKKWKNNVTATDGTILNDNTFPRHLFAHLSANKCYSGGSKGMWKPSGLDKFELAHIFGHKQDERDLESKVFKSFDAKSKPYGLFTSVSNVVLIPKGFAKPTDCMESIKICFYKRHLDLYGNNIVGVDHFDKSFVPTWYPEIEWLEPALPAEWERKIDNLLKYRVNCLKRKYRKKAV